MADVVAQKMKNVKRRRLKGNCKEIGWRGRIYQLTDSDTENYDCLQPSTALTSTPAKATSSAFPFCQAVEVR
jgi:hypothetical protein